MDKLTSVHDAMQRASLACPAPLKDAQIIVRIDQATKDRVAQVCESHGTTTSEFLRQCCAGLIADYTGAPAAE